MILCEKGRERWRYREIFRPLFLSKIQQQYPRNLLLLELHSLVFPVRSWTAASHPLEERPITSFLLCASALKKVMGTDKMHRGRIRSAGPSPRSWNNSFRNLNNLLVQSRTWRRRGRKQTFRAEPAFNQAKRSVVYFFLKYVCWTELYFLSHHLGSAQKETFCNACREALNVLVVSISGKSTESGK